MKNNDRINLDGVVDVVEKRKKKKIFAWIFFSCAVVMVALVIAIIVLLASVGDSKVNTNVTYTAVDVEGSISGTYNITGTAYPFIVVGSEDETVIDFDSTGKTETKTFNSVETEITSGVTATFTFTIINKSLENEMRVVVAFPSVLNNITPGDGQLNSGGEVVRNSNADSFIIGANSSDTYTIVYTVVNTGDNAIMNGAFIIVLTKGGAV